MTTILKLDTTHSAAEALSTVPYFAELAPECPITVEALARGAIRRDYNQGQVVFLEGETCHGLYIVQAGWFKSVKMSPVGREQVVRFVGPGEVFNEVGVLIESHQNLVTVIALEAARVWLIPREILLQLMEQCPRLTQLIIRHLAERVLYLLTLVEDLSLRTVAARLARLLLEQSTAGTVHRRRWATQAEMAARLGTVPDVLSRVLRSLTDEGLIKVERQRIQILDHAGLERMARDEEEAK